MLLLALLLVFQSPEKPRELDKIGEADSLRQVGIGFKREGDYVNALDYYKKAQTIFENEKHQIGIGDTKNNIGTVYRILGRYDLSLQYYQEALEAYHSDQYEYGKGKVYVGLGNLYSYDRKNHRKAHGYYKSAITVFSNPQTQNKGLLGVLNNNLGNLFKEEDSIRNSLFNLDSSANYYRRAIRIFTSEVPDDYEVAGAYLNLADLDAMKFGDSSLYYYKLAEEKFYQLGSKDRIAGVSLNRSWFYLQKNLFEKAREEASRSLLIGSDLGYRDIIHSSAKNLAESYEGLNQMDSAVYYWHLYIAHQDTFNNQQQEERVSLLEVSYETEKKEQQLTLRTAELDLRTAENRTLMTTLLVAVGFTFIVLIIFEQRQKALRSLREREADLRIKEQALREQQVDQLVRDQELKSINSMLEGEEKERKRIAEDLHDRVGSMLSAMKLQTESSDTKMTTLLDETVEEVRRISHNLETKVLNRFGLVAALEDLADKINSSEKIDFELQHLDLNERLDNKVEIHAYRIVQELVSNALKHSQAREIITQVNRIDNQLIITVEDNGKGFDSLAIKKNSPGMGLKNVKSRAQELNGNFNVDSGKGSGTTITVDFPL